MSSQSTTFMLVSHAHFDLGDRTGIVDLLVCSMEQTKQTW